MTEEKKSFIDSFFDLAENAVSGVESLSKGSSTLWRFDEAIDNDTGDAIFIVSDGHRKIQAFDADTAESLVNLLNREGF